jgi:hypothetical protein
MYILGIIQKKNATQSKLLSDILKFRLVNLVVVKKLFINSFQSLYNLYFFPLSS